MLSETIQGFDLSPQQRHTWLLQQRDGAAVYRSRCAIIVDGELYPEILAKALQSVACRHELLRTRFQLLPGMSKPLQVISTDSEFDYVWRDLRALPEAEKRAQRCALLEGAVNPEAEEKEWPALRVMHLTFETNRQLL